MKSSDFSHQFQLTAFYFQSNDEKAFRRYQTRIFQRKILHSRPRINHPYTNCHTSTSWSRATQFDTHTRTHISLSLCFSSLTLPLIYFCRFFSKYTYTDAPAKLFLLNCAFAFTCASALSVCVYSRFHLIMALWRLNKKQSKTVAVKLSLYFAAIASTAYTHRYRHTATVATHLFIIQTANTVYAYNLCGRICLQHRFWLIKKRKHAWKINAFEDENAKRFYFCVQVIKGQDNLVSEPIDSELISRCVVCTRYLRFCPRFLLVNTKKALDDYSKWCATWKNVILILFLAELKRPNVRRKREKSSIPWKKWWRQCTK